MVFHSSSNNTTNHVPFLRTRCAKNLRLTVRDFPLTICYLLFAIDPPLIIFPPRSDGRVAEWSNVPDSKSGDLLRDPWVRIPPLPLSLKDLRKFNNSSAGCVAVLVTFWSPLKCTKMAVFGLERRAFYEGDCRSDIRNDINFFDFRLKGERIRLNEPCAIILG